MALIKQPAQYINYMADEEYEPYDHMLVPCDGNGKGCDNLCEKGVGLCDKCISREVADMTRDF